MLIRFSVSNFRSIDAPQELSLVAVDHDQDAARSQERLSERLLTVAAIYGPNASGKSNVLRAIQWLTTAVQSSLRLWDNEIPTEPFAFGDGPGRPSQFEFEATVDGVRFAYLLDVDRLRVHNEALFHFPEGRRRRIFERVGDELTLQRGLGALSGTRELLTPQTLALSVARRFEEPTVRSFTRELLGIQAMGLQTRSAKGSYAPYQSTVRLFDDDKGEQDALFEDEWLPVNPRHKALALLRLADLGVSDVEVLREERSISDGSGHETKFVVPRVRLVHSSGGQSLPFESGNESVGTLNWFRLIGPVLSVLDRGGTLLFDELDASLHSTLSAEIIRIFSSPATNPRNAQLIYASHDTSLLSHLNRDQVWLTEKQADGSTRLGALADFTGERVRQSANIERSYLAGRFGALPYVEQTEFLRALRLIG